MWVVLVLLVFRDILIGDPDSSEALLSSSLSACALVRSSGSSILSASNLTWEKCPSAGSLMRPSPYFLNCWGLEIRTVLQSSMAYRSGHPLTRVVMGLL